MSALRAEDVEERKSDSSSVPCSGLRKELLECLRASDCVKIVSSPRARHLYMYGVQYLWNVST